MAWTSSSQLVLGICVSGPVCNVVQFVHSEIPRGARVISCEATLAHPEKSFGWAFSRRITIEALLIQAR